MSRVRYKTWLRFPVARVLVLSVFPVLVLVFVEGLSSTLIALKEVGRVQKRIRAYYSVEVERRHAQYDDELGWVSIPDVDLPDLYGSGKYLRTNSRGFRNDGEVDDQVSTGVARIVCSGDSFTFGQGVANDRTWCHLLSLADERMEAVNMGQRGYGVDQAFLWYMRDGLALDHDVHIFAFIDADFSRMKSREHHGYGKPILRLRGGELITSNVPVPRAVPTRRWISGVANAASGFRSIQLARWSITKLLAATDNSIQRVSRELFRTLEEVNRTKDSVLVLVWLPTEHQLRGEEAGWRGWMHSIASESGLFFIDLTDEMSELPQETVDSLFISRSSTEYIDAAGHYSERGHAWVAEALLEHLTTAEVQTVLSTPRVSESAAN